MGGQAGKLAASPAPTTTQTTVPGLSSSQLGSVHHSSSKNKIGAIVGGLLGGLALLATAVFFFLWRARLRRRQATRAAAASMFPVVVPLQEKKEKGPIYPPTVGAESAQA